MASVLRPALVLFVLLTLLTGAIYPALVTGVARTAFADQAAGSLVKQGEVVIGSRLVGQAFTQPEYFWSRPSATGGSPYNAAASGGSNLGPLNPALTDAVTARIAALRAADPGNTAPVPADLVTTSASGLDPHISVAAAKYQMGRVARARGLHVALVEALIDEHSKGRVAGFLGEPRVNVLELNMAVDSQAK